MRSQVKSAPAARTAVTSASRAAGSSISRAALAALASASHGTIPACSEGSRSPIEDWSAHSDGAPASAASNGMKPKPSNVVG